MIVIVSVSGVTPTNKIQIKLNLAKTKTVIKHLNATHKHISKQTKKQKETKETQVIKVL